MITVYLLYYFVETSYYFKETSWNYKESYLFFRGFKETSKRLRGITKRLEQQMYIPKDLYQHVLLSVDIAVFPFTFCWCCIVCGWSLLTVTPEDTQSEERLIVFCVRTLYCVMCKVFAISLYGWRNEKNDVLRVYEKMTFKSLREYMKHTV